MNELKVQIDALKPQAPEGGLHSAAQVLGPTVPVPARRARTHQSTFGADHQVLRVRMQRFGDQLLVDVRAIAVGGVEEVVPEFVGALQHLERIGAILGRAPDLRPADAHRPESEAFHRQFANADE